MKRLILLLLICIAAIAGEIKISENNATDPVYQLPLKKYPKWVTEAKLSSGKTAYFVSVKSMMTVYFHQPYFQKHKLIDGNITQMYVQDYISGRKIDAKKAFYLFGSRIVGPHGDDLIPFETADSAKLFMFKNGGSKILRFNKLSKGLMQYLDM